LKRGKGKAGKKKPRRREQESWCQKSEAGRVGSAISRMGIAHLRKQNDEYEKEGGNQGKSAIKNSNSAQKNIVP